VRDRGFVYGIRYDDTINKMRKHIEETDKIRPGIVRKIKTSDDEQEVFLENGSSVRGRLVVVATGSMSKLVQHLGMNRRLNPKLRSTAFGFDIEKVNNQPFDYDGITYFLNPRKHQIISITIFAIGNKMRLHMFAQWEVDDPRIRRMREHPIEELHRYFPKLKRYTGDISASSKVQFWPAQYGRLENVIQPGVVVMADAYQWVDSTGGFGLMKTMMDINVLSSHCIPTWLESEGMGSAKIEKFYNHPENRNLDDQAIKDWNWWYRKVHYSILRKVVARIWRKMGRSFNK
jgi:2-polyprenyl-6-methoxyphenol hydroxylase-like FAD-dependent oxidoreductase